MNFRERDTLILITSADPYVNNPVILIRILQVCMCIIKNMTVGS